MRLKAPSSRPRVSALNSAEWPATPGVDTRGRQSKPKERIRTGSSQSVDYSKLSSSLGAERFKPEAKGESITITVTAVREVSTKDGASGASWVRGFDADNKARDWVAWNRHNKTELIRAQPQIMDILKITFLGTDPEASVRSPRSGSSSSWWSRRPPTTPTSISTRRRSHGCQQRRRRRSSAAPSPQLVGRRNGARLRRYRYVNTDIAYLLEVGEEAYLKHTLPAAPEPEHGTPLRLFEPRRREAVGNALRGATPWMRARGRRSPPSPPSSAGTTHGAREVRDPARRAGADLKVPYAINGSRADTTAPEYWGTFNDAILVAQNSSGLRRGRFRFRCR